MPDDKKVSANPRYKVEEVENDAPIEEKGEEKKITSFSMIDAPLEKEKPVETAPKEDTEKPEIEDREASDKAPQIETVHEEVLAGETPASEPVLEEDDEIKKWLENTPNDPIRSNAHSGGGKGKYLALFLGILLIAALGGGIYYYRTNVEQGSLSTTPEKEELTEAPNETTEETPTPTPTVVALDLSKYKVQILNGGGVAGEAGKVQGYLQTAGFKDFKTGNASAFNYTDTQVTLKKDTPEEVFTKIKTELEKYYTGVVKSDKTLDEKSEFDLQVIVGKKK